MTEMYQIDPLIFLGLVITTGALVAFLVGRIRALERAQLDIQASGRKSEARFRHIFNHSHDAVLLVDLDRNTIVEMSLSTKGGGLPASFNKPSSRSWFRLRWDKTQGGHFHF